MNWGLFTFSKHSFGMAALISSIVGSFCATLPFGIFEFVADSLEAPSSGDGEEKLEGGAIFNYLKSIKMS